MIVSFSVSNFRSFSAEETLSLVASNRLSGSHDDHAVPIPDSKEKVLWAAVLYGANGAGKSNLFQSSPIFEVGCFDSTQEKQGDGTRAISVRWTAGDTLQFRSTVHCGGQTLPLWFQG